MGELNLRYDVLKDDFTCAGEASGKIKRTLKDLGFDANLIRNIAIAVYEGEINMVIHADGGVITCDIAPECITVVLDDKGPGIPDIDLAMQAGYSTAPENVRQLGFGAGMGLPNIKKYADNMNIETQLGVGTKITLEFIVK